MSNWRDQRQPGTGHRLVIDGVELVFGDDGVLRNASAEQVATMTAHPIRAARFVEVETPQPTPAPEFAAPIAAAETPAEATPRAPRGRRAAPPADSEGAE